MEAQSVDRKRIWNYIDYKSYLQMGKLCPEQTTTHRSKNYLRIESHLEIRNWSTDEWSEFKV